MEGETFGTNPGMLGIVLAIMEDLAVQIFVSIVASLLVDAIESALGQKKA